MDRNEKVTARRPLWPRHKAADVTGKIDFADILTTLAQDASENPGEFAVKSIFRTAAGARRAAIDATMSDINRDQRWSRYCYGRPRKKGESEICSVFHDQIMAPSRRFGTKGLGSIGNTSMNCAIVSSQPREHEMSEDTTEPRGTSAHMPDLNWSQVRETVLMLELAAVQIESAMKDSNASVEVLTNSFTSMAFQFYDNLVQRLAHVGISLGDLSNLVADGRRLYNPSEWVSLQDKIRIKYTTREEIAMFEAVMQGMPVQEAVDKFMAEMKEKNDDIELF